MIFLELLMQEIFYKYRARHMDYVAATLDILLTKGVREETQKFILLYCFDFA